MHHKPLLFSIVLCLLLVCAFLFTGTQNAHAVIGNGMIFNINSCKIHPNWMVVSNVVDCIQRQLQDQVDVMLRVLIIKLTPFALAYFAFALMLKGAHITMGVDSLNKEGMGFILRLMVAIYVFFNFMPSSSSSAGLGDIPFAFTYSGATMVSTALSPGNQPGWTPWASLDVALGSLLGYGPNFSGYMNTYGRTPTSGLLGIIGMSVTSGLVGILNFLFGFIGTLALIYFGIRAVFSYLAALVMIAFMVVIAPLIMPFVIMRYTSDRFVKKWLDLLIACMMNPIMIFAFLAAFLPVIQDLINRFYSMIFYTLMDNGNLKPGDVNMADFGRTGGSLGSWQIPSDPSVIQAFDSQLGGMGQGATVASSQNFMSPGMSSSMDIGSLDFAFVDFGPKQVQVMQDLIFSSLGFFIVAYLMLMLLDGIPQISDSIARVITGLAFEEMPFARELRSAVSRLRGAVGSS